MSQPPVTRDKYTKVAHAAQTFIHRGEMPTVEKIRLQVGGSPNAVAPLLKRWKASPEGAAAQERLQHSEDLPSLGTDDTMDSALLALLTPLRVQLQAEGQQQVEKLTTEKAAIIDALQTQVDEVGAELAKTQEALEAAQEAYELLTVDQAGALKTLEEQKEALVRTEEQRIALKQQCLDAEQAKAEALRQAQRDREALEQSRVQAVQQREALQQAHDEAIAVEKTTVERLSQQQILDNAASREKYARLQDELTQLAAEHVQLSEKTVPALEESLTTEREAKIVIADKHQRTVDTYQQTRETLAAVNAELAASKEQLQRCQAAQATVSQQLASVQEALSKNREELAGKEGQLMQALAQLNALTDKKPPAF